MNELQGISKGPNMMMIMMMKNNMGPNMMMKNNMGPNMMMKNNMMMEKH